MSHDYIYTQGLFIYTGVIAIGVKMYLHVERVTLPLATVRVHALGVVST